MRQERWWAASTLLASATAYCPPSPPSGDPPSRGGALPGAVWGSALRGALPRRGTNGPMSMTVVRKRPETRALKARSRAEKISALKARSWAKRRLFQGSRTIVWPNPVAQRIVSVACRNWRPEDLDDSPGAESEPRAAARSSGLMGGGASRRGCQVGCSAAFRWPCWDRIVAERRMCNAASFKETRRHAPKAPTTSATMPFTFCICRVGNRAVAACNAAPVAPALGGGRSSPRHGMCDGRQAMLLLCIRTPVRPSAPKTGMATPSPESGAN